VTGATGLVFLDIDDVLCLSSPYGGYAAIDALAGTHAEPDAVFRELFAARAREVLLRAHEEMDSEMSGALRYVISSTWREHFDRDGIETVFRRSGLEAIADRLHEGDLWRTPISVHRGQRADEIGEWLRLHHGGEPFVIVDDTFSGTSLYASVLGPSHPLTDRIVLCQEGVGLLAEHAGLIVDALRRPVDAGRRRSHRGYRRNRCG
jgi:hypothetical protein